MKTLYLTLKVWKDTWEVWQWTALGMVWVARTYATNPGFLWSNDDVVFRRNVPRLSTITWNPVKTSTITWKPVKLFTITWNPVKTSTITWNPVKLSTINWNPVKCYWRPSLEQPHACIYLYVCIYVCMYVYTYTYTYIHMHMYVYTQ